jgi:outer membrane protein TolC
VGNALGTPGARQLWGLLALVVCACGGVPAPSHAQSGGPPPLSLAQSLAIALENSTAVRAAGHAAMAADYGRKAAGADFLPKIGTDYSYTRFRNEPVMKSPPGDLVPYATTTKIGAKDRYQWSTHLRQPVFTGGALRAEYRMARLGHDVAREHLRAALQDTVLDVKHAYFSILKAEKNLMVALQAAEQVASHRATAQAFYAQEMIPKNDLLEAEVRHAQARQDVITATNRLEVARASFNTVLRRGIQEPVAIEDMLEVQPEEIVLEESLAEARQRRPELQSAMLQHARARAAVDQARSSYFPRIDLVAEYRKTGDDPHVSGSRYDASEVSLLYTVLSWNLFEWGKSSYQVSARKAQALAAEAQLQHVADSIALEVKHAWLTVHEAKKNIQVARSAIVHAEEDLRLNQLLYAEQMATTTDVLDAQTRLTGAYSNYYNALSDSHLAQALLERAMGRDAQAHAAAPGAAVTNGLSEPCGHATHSDEAGSRDDEPWTRYTLSAEQR